MATTDLLCCRSIPQGAMHFRRCYVFVLNLLNFLYSNFLQIFICLDTKDVRHNLLKNNFLVRNHCHSLTNSCEKNFISVFKILLAYVLIYFLPFGHFEIWVDFHRCSIKSNFLFATFVLFSGRELFFKKSL